jgi:Flp pilus assembly protein TadD
MVSDVLRVNPRDEEAIHYASLYEAMLGHKEAALALLRRIPEGSQVDPELRSIAAKIYYRLGMTDPALAELQKAVSAGYSRAWVRDDPAFAGLASSPQYQRIVQ